jgi:hypothetical protein
MFQRLVTLIVMVGTLTITGCNGGKEDTAKEIAGVVSAGVETVTQSSAGKGAPILLEAERHNSRVGQLQQAITLVRLYDKYGLRDIVLEGYLKERPDINTDWFTKVAGKTPEERARVAAQFLGRGEISAAEFMKLVYADITLHKAETAENYNVEPAGFPVEDYLIAISQVDPDWAEEKSKPFESEEAFLKLSGDEKLRLAKEIKEYAESKSVYVSTEAKQSMEAFINFMEKRMASNNSINDAITGVVNGRTPKVVVAIIGADHTYGMSQLLESSGRPYAVLTPLHTPGREEHGDLTDAMYDRKDKKLPVYSQGLSALVLQQFPSRKKPEPVIPEDWFGAEVTLYSSISRIAEHVLGPPIPPGPPGGGKPPFGLTDGDFDNQWLKIAIAKTEYLPNQDDRRRAMLIPVTFKRSGEVYWVGAVLKRGEEEPKSVEAFIAKMLQVVQAEEKTPEQAEDRMGRVQMTPKTFAVIGKDKEAVKRAILSES